MFCAMQSLQCETCYSAVRVSVSGVDGIQCKGWVGEYRLLSGVQQSDGLREKAVSRSAGPDAAIPSA